MKNFKTNPQAVSNWQLLKRAGSAAVFTTVLAIIPATMLPSTAMAGEFIEHFPVVQPVLANTESANKSFESAAVVLPESLVYAVENLLHTPNNEFSASAHDVRWNEPANDDWQVSLSLLKTGTLVTPTRWAMLRYTRPIW